MAIRQIFGPDSDSYKNPSKKMANSPRIPESYFWRIPDSSNVLKGFFFKLKNLGDTYVLKINVLYNSLSRIEPDFIRYSI